MNLINNIGDLLVFSEPVENPYTEVYSSKRIVPTVLDNLPKNAEVWYAPCSGGAQKLDRSKIFWKNSIVWEYIP